MPHPPPETEPGTEPDPSGFIRAGGGVALNGRRIAVVLSALGLAVLIVITAVVASSAVSANSQIDRLRSQGVPVQMTVTGCLGISSGIGMGIEYWQCRGTYSLDGRTYEEVIGGQRQLLDAGQRISVVAVPGHPSLVSIPQALRRRHSYTLAGVLAGVTVAWLLAGAALVVRDRRRRPPGGPVTTSG